MIDKTKETSIFRDAYDNLDAFDITVFLVVLLATVTTDNVIALRVSLIIWMVVAIFTKCMQGYWSGRLLAEQRDHLKTLAAHSATLTQVGKLNSETRALAMELVRRVKQ